MKDEDKKREELIKKLESLSTNSGSSEGIEKRRAKFKLRRVTRKSYIKKRSEELYPLASSKDILNKLQKDAWSLGYSEALENIISCLEDEEIMDSEAEFFAKLRVLSTREGIAQENIDKYKDIFKDIIKNHILKKIKDDSNTN